MAPGMPRQGSVERAARVREGLIWLAFVALLATAAVTVAVPELSQDPESDAAADAADAGTPP